MTFELVAPFPCERVEVPNTGFMRDQPTNCFVLGEREILVVDPGSEQSADVVTNAVERRSGHRVIGILLTHAHPDHAGSAGALKRRFDCPVIAHPGNRPIAGPHLSWDDVDVELDPSEPINVESVRLMPVMTPGHAPGHVALWHAASRWMIAGDLVSGNGTIGVFPPHGSMVEYLASLERVLAINPAMMLPGHGPPIDQPVALLRHYIDRRLGREREILNVIGDEGARIADVLPIIYPDILPAYTFPAEATILAHLLKLESEGLVTLDGEDGRSGCWRRRGVS